ncbi:MAG: cation:dicarboxylate symporter family transporter [Holosporales bacterium]
MLQLINKFKIILSILSIIIVALVFGESIPTSFKIYCLTFSENIRKILMFLLPFLIFPYMASSVASIRTRGVWLVGGIMMMVLASNFTSIMIPFGVGQLGIPHLGITELHAMSAVEELQPLFSLNLEPILKMEMAMILALTTGLAIGVSGTTAFDGLLAKYQSFSRNFFERIFIPTLPLYVLGTVLKITHEYNFQEVLPVFGNMILLIIATQLSYISFLYFIGSGGRIKRTITSIRNALPSSLVGFSTMSSVVTMPFTMKSAEQNIPDPKIARIAVSTTVNCHDVGECISLPMIALTIYFIHFGALPDLMTYVPFAFLVAVAQFSGVAVPGGSIVLILPFLSEYLNFSPEMSSMIIALSIFMDPLGTANNVLGNGAFAMIIYRATRMGSWVKRKITGAPVMEVAVASASENKFNS